MLQLHDVDITGPILLRIIFAAFLGGVVGLERAVHHKPAGLRTTCSSVLALRCLPALR